MVIQIQISDELWDYLNKEKKIRETFDELLKRKLKIPNQLNKEVEK